MKADADRGLWGAWARHERMRRDWTVEEVASRLAVEGKLKVDPATIRGVEGGSKKPSLRLQDALAVVFSGRPDAAPQPVGTTETPGEVLAAIRDQTAALVSLAQSVRQLVGYYERMAGPEVRAGLEEARELVEQLRQAAGDSPNAGAPPSERHT